jgi:CHAD domain-containing protein
MEAHLAGKSPTADSSPGIARQALLAQLDSAVSGLSKRRHSDRMIHEVRKELKRARATLRLMRECIGVEQYRRDNALVRDAARPLTAVRDAKVLIDAMRRWIPDRGEFAQQLRRTLERQRRATLRQLRPAALRGAIRELRAIRRRAAAYSEPASVLEGEGLKRAYKSGRKAFIETRRRRSDESLHEWRKQTKYFASQLELVLPFGPKRFEKSLKRAKRLGEQLGDDHDLAILTEQIYRHAKGKHSPSQDERVQSLIDSLARERRKLQKKARELGRRLYSSGAHRYERAAGRPT